MDREREEIHALLTQTHTQNMEQDNNSHPENVHSTASGTLYVGQWIEKGEKYMHFKHKHTLKTWNKTTTHHLRMYIIWRVEYYRSMDRERGEIHAL